MEERCIVKGCKNHKGEGTFVGKLCYPCHEMITTGRVHHANTTFIGNLERQRKELVMFAKNILRHYNATPDEWDHLKSILGENQ